MIPVLHLNWRILTSGKLFLFQKDACACSALKKKILGPAEVFSSQNTKRLAYEEQVITWGYAFIPADEKLTVWNRTLSPECDRTRFKSLFLLIQTRDLNFRLPPQQACTYLLITYSYSTQSYKLTTLLIDPFFSWLVVED